MTWLLARCQQAVWRYEEWGECPPCINDTPPSLSDAFFALVGRFCFRGWIV